MRGNMEKRKVFMIPYAGASAFAYYYWKKDFPENLQPEFVELAGRGCRGEEPLHLSVQEAAMGVADYIMTHNNGDEYIIYGHSMGALIAYEAYYELLDRQYPLPVHVYFSGQEPPQYKVAQADILQYTDDEFLKIVAGFGGLPKEFYNEEVKREFLPILRADFGILNHYRYSKKKEKIKCDISILYGDEDFTVNMDKILYWSEHAGKNINFHGFLGDHFFIKDNYKTILEIMKQDTEG